MWFSKWCAWWTRCQYKPESDDWKPFTDWTLDLVLDGFRCYQPVHHGKPDQRLWLHFHPVDELSQINWTPSVHLTHAEESHIHTRQLQAYVIMQCSSYTAFVAEVEFLPCCMECRRGLAMRILSVRPSVRQTRQLWQICSDFYTIRKNIYPSFLRRRTVGGGDPFYPKFSVNRPPLERNRRFWTNNRS